MKKYMAFDLVMLTIFGFGLEWLTVAIGSNVIFGPLTMCITLLIVFLATVRWNFYGLLVVPFIVIGMYVGGITSGINEFESLYDWRIYIATVIGLMIFAINPIFYIKFGTKKFVDSPWKIILILIVEYVLANILQIAIYRMLTVGSPIKPTDVVSTTESYEFTFESGITYNLLGLALSAVGLIVLRSQGIVCNVKQKFIEDRKNAELDRKDREFRIKDSNDEENGASPSSNGSDESSKEEE